MVNLFEKGGAREHNLNVF